LFFFLSLNVASAASADAQSSVSSDTVLIPVSSIIPNSNFLLYNSFLKQSLKAYHQGLY